MVENFNLAQDYKLGYCKQRINDEYFEDNDHKIDILNLVLPIVTVSLPLIVVRDSINKVTQTLLRVRTLLRNHLFPTT